MNLTERLKHQAHATGFDLAGTCPAVAPDGIHHFYRWLENGFAGDMGYIEQRRDAYAHPKGVLPEVRSLLVLGTYYATTDHAPSPPGFGRVSNYAWGEGDYHDLIHGRLKQLVKWLSSEVPSSRSRGVVDTAPLLERDFARLAGLGWVGKNTMLINRDAGSYFFLAAVLTDVELEYDDRFSVDHCGKCTACLDQCPTDAFPEPYVLDATKCISYLTIEHRTAIDESLRQGIGDWLFGCDVCQQVCPWNRKPQPTCEPTFHPLNNMNPIDLCELFELTDDAFRSRFRKTPLWRAKRTLILRNAAIVLGNQKFGPAKPVLRRALNDSEEIVCDACQWALDRIG
ncbi:MAG: tRNA epoxyqueuosine(34) reductase QueG [Planctomycetales bacterium]|nr:tRNA epoxyqueuosine(34) reductase QueG [Planctomycetales bacterium]